MVQNSLELKEEKTVNISKDIDILTILTNFKARTKNLSETIRNSL